MFKLTKLKLESFVVDSWLEVEESPGTEYTSGGVMLTLRVPRGPDQFRLTLIFPHSSIRVLIKFLQQIVDDPTIIH